MNIELDSAVSRYMAAVQKAPKLSREEETALWRRWQKDLDEHARDTLISANLRYVVAIALRYRHYGLPVADLIAEGNLGIMRALAKFEPERGNRFVTYAAYWIRALILNHVVCSWSLVGAGSGALRSKLFFRLRRERVRITSLVGEGDRVVEILAERFNASRSQMLEMIGRVAARDVSLDSKGADGAITTLVDTLASSGITQEEAYMHSERKRRVNHVVHSALETLDRRERYVVENHLMADKEEAQSLAEMGRRLGVSRERVRQLETRAKHKLTQHLFEMSGSSSLDEVSDGVAAE
jgi:RNA polymerase sigma-32 factor